jgi:hypothetical protein
MEYKRQGTFELTGWGFHTTTYLSQMGQKIAKLPRSSSHTNPVMQCTLGDIMHFTIAAFS